VGFKGGIFDMDGVLVNTVPLHFKAWKKMFKEYGKDFSFEDYEVKVDGIPRLDGARAILSELSDGELKKAASKKQKFFLELLDSEGVDVYDDTINLINKIKKMGIKVAAISSSKNCIYILKSAQIDTLFDVIITGNDIKKGKPDPEIFLLASERMNLFPKECVVFEDAVLGVQAAKTGGFKCVGIDRYNAPERLKKADLVVSDLSQLEIEKIKKLFI